jgi:hypothetical protein
MPEVCFRCDRIILDHEGYTPYCVVVDDGNDLDLFRPNIIRLCLECKDHLKNYLGWTKEKSSVVE